MTATEEAAVPAPRAEIAVRQQATAIPAKLAYARELANSGLLPAAYRKNPANVLWAMEYGEMLGLAPMAAMIGVHVIDGKPTASAGLISGLVRQAGHKLRLWGDGDSATCEIIRSDEPKHVFSVTWTLKKTGPNPSAEQAKLLSKEVWQKYPASMLKSRATTQCARDACDEVLFGLHYTPEELGADVDEDGVIVDEAAYDEQEHPAARSPGTPDDDPWYVRPDPDAPVWPAHGIEQAAALKSVHAAKKLWRETAAKADAGEITGEDAENIQALITARLEDLRAQAAEAAMGQLSEDEPWRAKIEELADTTDARRALDELGQLITAGTIDARRGGRISRAIVARYPKATEDEATA